MIELGIQTQGFENNFTWKFFCFLKISVILKFLFAVCFVYCSKFLVYCFCFDDRKAEKNEAKNTFYAGNVCLRLSIYTCKYIFYLFIESLLQRVAQPLLMEGVNKNNILFSISKMQDEIVFNFEVDKVKWNWPQEIRLVKIFRKSVIIQVHVNP